MPLASGSHRTLVLLVDQNKYEKGSNHKHNQHLYRIRLPLLKEEKSYLYNHHHFIIIYLFAFIFTRNLKGK